PARCSRACCETRSRIRSSPARPPGRRSARGSPPPVVSSPPPFGPGPSAGASRGAVLAVALGLEPALVPLAAFGGAMAAIALVWRLARLGGRTTILTVLLAGVVLTSFAGALVTFILVSSDRLSLRLRAVLGWLQGGI